MVASFDPIKTTTVTGVSCLRCSRSVVRRDGISYTYTSGRSRRVGAASIISILLPVVVALWLLLLPNGDALDADGSARADDVDAGVAVLAAADASTR